MRSMPRFSLFVLVSFLYLPMETTAQVNESATCALGPLDLNPTEILDDIRRNEPKEEQAYLDSLKTECPEKFSSATNEQIATCLTIGVIESAECNVETELEAIYSLPYENVDYDAFKYYMMHLRSSCREKYWRTLNDQLVSYLRTRCFDDPCVPVSAGGFSYTTGRLYKDKKSSVPFINATASESDPLKQYVFMGKPVVLSQISSTFGGDTASTRHYRVNQSTANISIEEEKSLDTRISHTKEQLTLFGFEQGLIYHFGYDFFAPVRSWNLNVIGEAFTLETEQGSRDAVHTEYFSRKYNKPVVFAQMMTRNGGQPAHVRINSVSSDHFTFQLEEWAYLDGYHVKEEIAIVVLEEGRHTISYFSDGITLLEVGTIDVDHKWSMFSRYGASSNIIPEDFRLITQVQSKNDPTPVITRQRLKIIDHDSAEMQVKLQEEEGETLGHANESVGFLVNQSTIMSH